MTDLGDGRGSRERVQWCLQTSSIQRFLRTRRYIPTPGRGMRAVRQLQRIKFPKWLRGRVSHGTKSHHAAIAPPEEDSLAAVDIVEPIGQGISGTVYKGHLLHNS
ncbi:TPA: hypothetical protein ACH3X1_013597 [Trebouxia sp. C0004]